jgi:Spy/CpxP family protein refolding chaperone
MLAEHARMDIPCANGPATALVAAALLLAASLGGCATSTAGPSLMDARAEMPTHPKTTGYLPVEDLPPNRQIMTSDQQSKLKNELIAARARQEAVEKASKQQ